MRQLDEYKKATINMSDNVRIVSLLFDGALNFLKLARERMKEHKIAEKGFYIGKATAVIGELASSLNMEQGGEIARNLRRLYDFVLGRLLEANLKNDMAALGEAEKVLEVLRTAWKDMEKRNVVAVAESARKSADVAGMSLRA